MKILVVDDIKQNRYLLQKLLEGHGYTVETASNGVEAIEKARVSPPDMVVTDTLMPKMDGFQLCRELKKDEELKSIPILFYSATYTDKESRKLALDIGAVEYIIKPTEPDKFIKIVKEVLDKYEKRELKPAEKPLEEKVYMKLYNERLIQKLEKKMLDLEMEITERKQAFERVEHLNNVLRAIRGVNQLIVKEKKIDRLLKGACDNIIETRGYYNAWIAVLDESGGIVKTAEAGLGKDFLTMIKQWKRGEMPDCARKAVSQSDVVVTKDPASTCAHCPLSAQLCDKGAMTVQLEHEGKVYGLFCVSMPRDFLKDKEEQSLFKEVAGDIGFALYSIELEEERKQAGEELKESEEEYRTLVESSTDAIFMMGNERRIVSCNQAFLDLFGYEKNELEGKSIRIIHQSDESFDAFRDTAYPVIEKIGSFMIEWEFVRKNGTILPAETVTSAIKSPDGSTTGYVAIIRDITERKQAEEEKKKVEAQLQQAQKMEAIGALAGGIAHDFNNILSLIIGYTELTMMNLPEGSPARENMNNLFKAGERARDLVKQILTFSRQREKEKKPVQIHLIVKETLKLLRPSLPTTIDIHQNITSTSTVMADPTQIHQVIMNLCTNAYHAMSDKGGVLEVGLADVELDSEFTARHLDTNPGPYLRLTVSDTGHGIKKKDIDRIFEPYYTTKEKTGGTGMGLSVMHGIVKSHGGAITVYSEPGKGSTFNVFLPKIEEAEGVTETEEMGPILMGKERILFIDDEPAIVDIGKGMLESLGYKVVTRTSSIEALEAFKALPEKFDLVITDMTMPKMTGDDLAKELMKIRPDIPIIVCTGFSERINEEKAKAMGIRKLVMKPVVQRELAEAVREALD